MKYLLIKNNVSKGTSSYSWHGFVVTYIMAGSTNYKVKVLCDPVYNPNAMSGTKKGDCIHVSQANVVDVTLVYNKIQQLCVDLSRNDIKVWTKVDKIRKEFKNGYYPSKIQFKWMNEAWNKIK